MTSLARSTWLKHLDRRNCGSDPAKSAAFFGARCKVRTMREEFASKIFLAVAVLGLVALFSGLVAFAFS